MEYRTAPSTPGTETTHRLPNELQNSPVQGDQGSPQQGGGIDVAHAKQQFGALSRRLTQLSQAASADPEKAEAFNLIEYLRGISKESDEAGLKSKLVGVTWTDLGVSGVAASTFTIPTIPDLFREVFVDPCISLAKRFGLINSQNSKRKLLQGFHGVARPYQMTLVIGRPGSGCSTFLKVIANQRQGFLGVEGDVKYAGLDAQEFARRYPGETAYAGEDDIHYETLTVKQTLDFALALKVPGKRLPRWADPKTFRAEVLETLLSALNIAHTANTKVGGPHVRGVSGGERKRVSIAEMFATRACVLSWDNSTRGLDASTALDFAKSLRICCDLLDLTLFASLYQAGEGIYDLFDKVLVIDEGRCIYYGPCKEARAYMLSLGFQDMPRQTTADYLSGCTDPNERRLTESGGRFSVSNPPTPESLEQAYKESGVYEREMALKAEYERELGYTKVADDFRQAVREDKNKGVRSQSRYTVSFFEQVWRLMIRQIQILAGDLFDVAFGLFASVVLGCVTGSTFKSLPQTAEGGFTRGGVLFLTLLFNALVAFTELPVQMGQKPILYKQQSYCFFRPSALSIAQLFADIPFSLPRVFLFVTCSYFIAGLRSDAGAFLTFFLIVYTLFVTLVCMFKIFAATCKSYDVAARMATITIVVMVLFSGYMQPRMEMKRFLFWITYLNPVYFAFEASMVNEFKGLALSCVGSYVTPRGAGFQDSVGQFQTCTLPGAIPGQQIVRGIDYITAAFGFRSGDLWKSYAVCLAYFVGLVLIGAVAVEVLDQNQTIASFTVKKKPNDEEETLNARLRDRQINGRTESEKPIEVRSEPFTWEGLTYTVPVKGGTRQLLDNIDGFCEPGTLTALMGASGAGKSTLLDVLSNRKSIGVIGGSRLISGQPIDASFQRGCGYAEQQDVHEPTTTVREALRFSAYLRQDAHVSKAEKDAYVEDIIELLEMQDLADAMVGTPEGLGLDVGDRKRLTIGVELAAKPDLLLFLDEPTSGLDGQTAYNVVRFLKKLAAAGQAILCTIHQPNSLLFENFDRLLLLQRGGQVVYFGPVGQDSVHIREYFAERGAVCPANVNMAEFMLDAVGAGLQPRIGDRDWAELYKESDLYVKNLQRIADIKERCSPLDKEVKVKSAEYASSYWTQVVQVGRRALISSWRQPDYQFTRLLEHAAVALLTGLLFLRLEKSVAGLQARIFGIFMLTVVPAVILIQTEPYFMLQRGIYNREQSSKMYSGTVFAIGQMMAELPFSFICAVVYFVLFYYISGFQSDSERAAYFFAFVLLNEIFSVTLAQCVAALSPDLYTASLANPFILLIFDLFCGVTVPKPHIPSFWRAWLYPLNPYTRLIGGLIINELEDLPITCQQRELALFNPPPSQTCAQYASQFVSDFGGYLANPNATAACAYCPYAKGDEFLPHVGLGRTRAREMGIFVAFCVSNVVILLLACRFLRYSKR